MDLELVRKIQELERRLDRLALPEIGWTPVFLDTPYTNTDFDGDSFSDVGSNTKIENTSWSTTIPSDAKALLLRMAARDSGSAGQQSTYFALYPAAAAATAVATVQVGGLANNSIHEEVAIVPCTDGDIWYRVEATGASTLDVWLWCTGYWI